MSKGGWYLIGVAVVNVGLLWLLFSKPSTPVNDRTVQEQQRIGTIMKLPQGDVDCFIYYGTLAQTMSCVKVR